MKKQILIICFAFASLLANAQLKAFSGGYIVAGATPSSPPTTSKLQVVGNSVFTSTTSTITSAAYIRGLNGYSTATTPDFTWFYDDQTGLLHPASNIIGFTTNGNERMRLTNNGLLLGTTTDLGYVKLNVTAPQNYQAMQSTTTFTYDGGYHEILWVNRANTHAFTLYNTATSTTTPTYFIQGTGDVTGKSFTSTSDKNLKENIDTLRSPLSKLKQLRGVTYNFKQSVTGLAANKKEIGLLAQDVEVVIPEVVYTSDQGIKSIAYGNLTALLIEAIKEQDKKITQLRNDLDSCCNIKKTGKSMNQDNNGSGEQGKASSIHELELANNTVLFQNYPNPFGDGTTIKYFIPDNITNAEIIFLDEFGNKIKEFKVEEKGMGQLNITTPNLSSGVYSYSLIVNGKVIDTKKMMKNK